MASSWMLTWDREGIVTKTMWLGVTEEGSD